MKTNGNGVYHETPDCSNGRTRGLISGRSLAHGKRSILSRAFLGADWHLNRVELISPTIKQCANNAGVCVPYLTAAVAIVAADDQAAREAVLAGEVPLLEAAHTAVVQSPVEDAWPLTEPKDREKFIRNNLAEVWHLIDAITA
jgi:hypothetical protein